MIFSIIKISILSIILIFLVHNLINYLRETLTIPINVDLINDTKKQYENMYKIISSQQEPLYDNTITTSIGGHIYDYHNNNEPFLDMKTELSLFVKNNFTENGVNSSTNINDLYT
jgi:hypothetical protein